MEKGIEIKDLSPELRKQYYENFGEFLCNRFNKQQLDSNITFTLSFPQETGSDQLTTNSIPNADNIGKLLEEITRLVPNRKNCNIIIKYYIGIGDEKQLTGEVIRVKNLDPSELLLNKANLTSNILLQFRSHFSINQQSTQQNLELDVYFEEIKYARLYVISKDVYNHEKNKKDGYEKLFKKCFNEEKITDDKNKETKVIKEIYKNVEPLPIQYLQEYSDNNFEKDGNDLLYIIVDQTYMTSVVEKHINNAHTINILIKKGDGKEAEKLQKAYKSKILAVHFNMDILLSKKNFIV